MSRLSLSDLMRALARPAWRGWMLWAVVLALSMLSFYVHLWRASAFRGEAAYAAEVTPMLATKGKSGGLRQR